MGSNMQPLGVTNPSQKRGFRECLLPGAPSLRHNLLLHRHGSVPASGIPRGKKKQAALWQQPGTGTETCAHQLLLLAAPWLCHPPRHLLSLCQQRPAAATSTVPWHSLSPAPPRTFLCPPHSPGCRQSLLSPAAARISSGVDFSPCLMPCSRPFTLQPFGSCGSAEGDGLPGNVTSQPWPRPALCVFALPVPLCSQPVCCREQHRASAEPPSCPLLPLPFQPSPAPKFLRAEAPCPAADPHQRAVPRQWCHRCPRSLPPLLVVVTRWGQSWARLHGTLKDPCVPKLGRKNIRLHGELWRPCTTRPAPRVLLSS